MTDVDRGPQGRHRSNTSNGADDRALDELGQRFAKYRLQGKRSRRIPKALREIAVEMVARGVSPAALRRRCGVTAEQLRHWQHAVSVDAAAAGDASEAAQARCFSVVDAIDGDRGDGASRGRESLELRVGAWAITIRPNQG